MRGIDLRIVARRQGVRAERRRVGANARRRNAERRGIGWRDGGHHRQVLRPALVTHEIERAIADHRAAGRAAVVVALKLRLRRGRRQQERPRAEPILAREHVGRAMRRIASRSRERILQSAGDAAELRGEVGDGLELLHGLLRDHQVTGAALQVVRDPVDVHLPQPESAIHGARRAGARAATRDRRRVDAGLQDEEVEDAAADGRDGPHGAFVVVIALHRAADFHRRLRRGDLHRFRERRRRHREFNGERLPRAQHNAGPAHRRKRRDFHEHDVFTGRQ